MSAALRIQRLADESAELCARIDERIAADNAERAERMRAFNESADALNEALERAMAALSAGVPA